MKVLRKTDATTPIRRTAFTLVELLCVIGVIAVIIGMLLPALVRARQAAYTAACLSNLRQIGQAAFSYTADNHGYIIPAGYSTVFAPGVTQNETWAQLLVAMNYLPKPNILASASLSPNTDTVFYCPACASQILNGAALPISPIDGNIASGRLQWGWSQTDSQTNSTPTGAGVFADSRIIVHNWYYINGTLNCPKITGWTAPLPCKWIPGNLNTAASPVWDWTLNKITQLQRTTELVFVADGMVWQGDRDANFINGRHGDTRFVKTAQTNILFFDGHAATFRRDELPLDAPTSQFALTGPALSAIDPTPIWRTDQY